ncbi:LuxR C-terminal-related transcriptional regulator [Microbacterium phyllosphaerae]|uniref:LuxR C-terminal-related transcriptional regulator n=1 Tax=Microbacterium phyllosphaerae TaxID=124798 RepID=UPI003D65BDF4
MGVLPSIAGSERTGPRFPTLPRHLLPRTELIARLDDGAALTVVLGVQGYGKTTLLAEWAWRRAGRGLPTVWLTASSSVNDRASFESALRREWREVVRDAPLVSAAAASAPWSGREDDPDDVVIVVDDFQEIDDPEVIRDLLRLPLVNRGLRIVVSTRRQHPIERLGAAEIETRVILSRELLLTPDQIGELSRLVGRPVDARVARRVHEAVGGWISAVRIVLELTRDDAPLPLAAVREYFGSTVFPAVRDERVLGALMRFSLPEVVDTDMVRALAGAEDPDRHLEALERPGLFERRYVEDRVELLLPSVIRELLRDKYQTLHPEAARTAHREFARWFEAAAGENDLMSAFEHAVHAQDWPMAVRLWQERATLFFMSFPQRFHRALAALPPDVATDERGMRVTRESLSVFAGGIGDGVDGTAAWFRAYAEAGSRALAEGTDGLSLRDLLHFAPARLIGLRALGRFEDAVAFATSVSADVAQRLVDGEEPGDRLCWFHLQAALTHRIVGDEIAAVPAYRLAWEHAARSGVTLVAANAAASLGLIYAYRSDHPRARLWLERQQQAPTRGHWADHLVHAPARVASALLKLDALDGEGAREEIARNEDASASLDAWQAIAYVSAQYALHFGDADSALAQLDEAERTHATQRGGDARAFVLLTRARADLLLMAGRVHEAVAGMLEHPENLLLTVPRARAHLLAGEYEEARILISAEVWNARRRVRDRLELLLLDAVCALRLGDRDAASAAAHRAIPLLRGSGALRVLTTVSRTDLDAVLDAAAIVLTREERTALDAAADVYPEQVHYVALTERERSLLLALEAGATRKEIADELFLSINTVKTQLGALYEKLGASSRVEALRQAHLLRLL